jgi:hypothetical protein
MAEAGISIEAEDLLLVAVEAETEKCSVPSAVTAERNVRYLLNQPEVSRSIAVTVSKKWVEEETIQEGLMIGVALPKLRVVQI